MFKFDSENPTKNGEYSLYEKYFDINDIEDDESIYKKQLYILEDEKFTKKDESSITLKHKSLLNRLILEDYSIFPLKQEKNNEYNIEDLKVKNEDKGTDKLKEKGNQKRNSVKKEEKKIDELEKYAEDESEFIKDLHRINYITFSPFCNSFFNKENINEIYKGNEKLEKIMKQKEDEKKLLQMINFDYNNYEYNDELLLNICHGFIDIDKLKEENCINPFGVRNTIMVGVNPDISNNQIDEEKSEKNESINESLSGADNESEHINEEEKEQKDIGEIKEEIKEDKKKDIITSELNDEINQFIKQREDIEFYEQYFEEYDEEKKIMKANMKITDEQEKEFYLDWINKFKETDILYKKYLMQKERMELLEKEKIKKYEKELEIAKLSQQEKDKKFINELNKIRKKTLQRIREEEREKIYFLNNEINGIKNKRRYAVILKDEVKDTNTINSKKSKNSKNSKNSQNKNNINKKDNKEYNKDRFDWMNTKKDNFFNNI